MVRVLRRVGSDTCVGDAIDSYDCLDPPELELLDMIEGRVTVR